MKGKVALCLLFCACLLVFAVHVGLRARYPVAVQGIPVFEMSRRDLHDQLLRKGYGLWKQERFQDIYETGTEGELTDTLRIEYGYLRNVTSVSGDACELTFLRVQIDAGDTRATIEKKLGKPDRVLAMNRYSVLTFGGNRLALVVDDKGFRRFALKMSAIKNPEHT